MDQIMSRLPPITLASVDMTTMTEGERGSSRG